MSYLYLFWGKVIKGKNRGKYLGFPTINLRLHRNIPEGVYVSMTKICNKWFRSVSFVGAAKTFGDTQVFAETHVLDFNRDLYGKRISVRLLKKMRDNKKFVSPRALTKQMREDKKKALFFFLSHHFLSLN